MIHSLIAMFLRNHFPIIDYLFFQLNPLFSFDSLFNLQQIIDY